MTGSEKAANSPVDHIILCKWKTAIFGAFFTAER